jgi:hypothetical protein
MAVSGIFIIVVIAAVVGLIVFGLFKISKK